MKTITLILALFLASCSKQAIEANRPSETQYSNLAFAPVYAGSNASIKFTFTLTTQVQKINLYRVPETLVYYVNNPNPGAITMYDHLVDTYPTYSQHYFYQLEFVLNDGTKVLGDKFQVY